MLDDRFSAQPLSRKNEKKGLLTQASKGLLALEEQLAVVREAAFPLRFSSAKAAADNRTLFIEAMSDPAKRQIAFNVVERNCRARFAEGAEGVELYLQLLKDVQRARVDAAVIEFEKRFMPMLYQDLLKGRFEPTKKR